MSTIVATNRQTLIIPHRTDVAQLIPSSKAFKHHGKSLLAVPHKLEEWRLLRNLGVQAEHPIHHYYQWPGMPPFESQRDTAAMLSANRRAYVLSSMGVGKTRAALYAYDYLRQTKLVRKVLVVAPLSTLVPVWQREVFQSFEHLRTVVLHGTRKKRQMLLREKADIYVINHDGIKVIQNELIAAGFDVVIVDELASYRNRQTDRWKMLQPLVTKAKFAWGLTGSPTPNEPTDAYGQVRLITPEHMSCSFRAFKQQTMRQVSTFRWIEREEANEVVHRAMQPAVRYTLDECHDLPPVTYQTRDVELSPAQKKAYRQMMNDYAADIKDKRLTAANEAVKVGKLLQLGCGFMYDSEGKPMYVGAKARLKLLLELIEEAEAKVIVFAPFTAAVRLIELVLVKKLGAHAVARIDGSVTKTQRDHIFSQFRNSAHPRVLAAHPGTMSHGLTLTEANTIVWFAPTYSAETWEQANARINRPGQTRHTHIVKIESTPIEKGIYRRLAKRTRMQGVLLDMFKQQGD